MINARLRVGLVLGGWLLAAASCGSGAQRPIVLIVLDTVRADHTSLYGYERDTTPTLAALAREGVVVENAFAAAAWTLPSMASILSGQWPSVHGAGFGADNRFLRSDASIPSLAEILRASGYRTGLVASAGYFDEEFGLSRGFEHYDYLTGSDEVIRRVDESVDRALEWLDEVGDAPFFLMFHAFDAHRHYDAPEPARGTFTDAFVERYGDTLATLESRLEAEREGDLEFHIAAYDEEILFLDGEIARLLRGLQARGLSDDALVVLTADHGEAFFEHDSHGHGACVHNEVIQVPFVVWGPGVVAGRRVGPVSTVDILPTVLEFAHVEVPPAAGISMWPLLRGEALPERILFSENSFYGTSLTAAVRWPYKAIRDFKGRATRLYDLASDPQETFDLMSEPDRSVRRIARDLTRQARDLRDVTSGEGVTLDEETRARLRALGYIH